MVSVNHKAPAALRIYMLPSFNCAVASSYHSRDVQDVIIRIIYLDGKFIIYIPHYYVLVVRKHRGVIEKKYIYHEMLRYISLFRETYLVISRKYLVISRKYLVISRKYFVISRNISRNIVKHISLFRVNFE